jgi:hypothetical protein
MIDPRSACLGVAALCGVMLSGVALGRFVTGNTHVSWYASGGGVRSSIDEGVGNPDAVYPPRQSYAFASGPAEPVVCKGCGPGINGRMQGGFAFGYDDAVVRDYLAHDDPYRPAPIDYAADPLPGDNEHDAGPLSRPMTVEPAGQRVVPAPPAPTRPADDAETSVQAEPVTTG